MDKLPIAVRADGTKVFKGECQRPDCPKVYTWAEGEKDSGYCSGRCETDVAVAAIRQNAAEFGMTAEATTAAVANYHKLKGKA